MENNKRFCIKCGKEMKATDKFCMGCGSKNESITENVAKDEVNVEVSNSATNSSNVVNNTPVKAKSNKKLIGVGIVALLLLVVAMIAPRVYAMLSPTGYVKSAISNTFDSIEKNSKKFNEVPTLSSLFVNNDGNRQKELYLKIEDVNADALGIPLDASMLEDYGISLKLQSNKDNTAGNVSLCLLDGKSELVNGKIHFNKDLVAVESPKLFEDVLAVKIEDDKKNEEKDKDKDIEEDLSELDSMLDMFSELANSSKEIETIYRDLTIKYGKQLVDLAEFKKDKSDKNLYTATIDGDSLVSILTEYITELLSKEEFRDYLATSMYASEGYNNKEYYRDMVDNMALAFPDELDYMLEEIEIGDLLVDVIVENKAMESMEATFSMSSNGETFKLKYAMDYINEKDSEGIDFSLKFGVSSYDSIEGSLIYSKEGKDLSRNASVDMKISEVGGVISFDFVESLKDDKKYENSLTCSINDDYENVQFQINTEGSYENKEKINYNDIELVFDVDGEAINLNLSGYAANTKIKSVDKFDAKKVVYMEDLDEQDYNELYEEITKNFYLIMKSFGNII